MYDSEYGTDWQALDPDETFERAYALGVAETLGESYPGELDRLVKAVSTARDQALVQLAYDKGRSRGKTAISKSDSERKVWSTLLDESEREPVPITSERELPRAIRSLPLLDRPDDRLDRIRLPRFLTRR